MLPREEPLKERINKATSSLKTYLLILIFSSLSFVSGVFSREVPAVSRELHWAVTDEKFELALERLWIGKKTQGRVPIVLSHGFFVNSLLLNLDEDYSLGRYLAGEGFDVWNLSFRGTGRSLNPLREGPKSWSLDDMIERDLFAVIRYVQKESGSAKIFWLGYEMGGLLLYGYLVKKGDSGLLAGVTIGAPVTFNDPQQEPMKKLLSLERNATLKKIFLSLNAPFLGRLLIPLVPSIERLFYNPENIEDEVREKLLGDALASINPGVLDHLLLIIKRGEFVSAKGDFSYRKNLAKIQLPLLLIGGEKDMLAPPASIRAVHRAVSSADRTLRVFGPSFRDSTAYGHVDLVLGTRAKDEVFPVIGRWLKKREGLRQ